MKEALGEFGIYGSEKLAPTKTGIAIDIAPISVSVAKLLQLPGWGTVSISGLHMMLLSDIGLCRFRWMWIGSVRKHCL